MIKNKTHAGAARHVKCEYTVTGRYFIVTNCTIRPYVKVWRGGITDACYWVSVHRMLLKLVAIGVLHLTKLCSFI